MKKKDLQKLREKSVADLKKEANKLREERDSLAAQMAVGKVADLKKRSKVRKDLAQVLTLIRQKESEEKGKEK